MPKNPQLTKRETVQFLSLAARYWQYRTGLGFKTSYFPITADDLPVLDKLLGALKPQKPRKGKAKISEHPNRNIEVND